MEMTYKIGDHVRYGVSGVCVVADVETIPAQDLRSTKTYYVLRPVAESGTKIFVPLDNPALLGRMHALLSPQEINDAIDHSEALPWLTDRNRRAEVFKATLKTAEPLELLGLCRCLYQQRKTLEAVGKHLSSSDEAALKQAERLVEGEFSFSLGISKAEVSPYIRSRFDLADS